MQDGAIVANTGHFNVEIDIPALEKLSVKKRTMREFVEEYTLADGRRIYLLAEGRLVNLAAAEGHPAAVMDMSFANQSLARRVHGRAPRRARRRRSTSCRKRSTTRSPASSWRPWASPCDTLTEEQAAYLASWDQGT